MRTYMKQDKKKTNKLSHVNNYLKCKQTKLGCLWPNLVYFCMGHTLRMDFKNLNG